MPQYAEMAKIAAEQGLAVSLALFFAIVITVLLGVTLSRSEKERERIQKSCDLQLKEMREAHEKTLKETREAHEAERRADRAEHLAEREKWFLAARDDNRSLVAAIEKMADKLGGEAERQNTQLTAQTLYLQQLTNNRQGEGFDHETKIAVGVAQENATPVVRHG